MKSDKKSIAIRVAWIFGIMYIVIMLLFAKLFVDQESMNYVVILWASILTWVAYKKGKELKSEIKNN